MCTGRLRWGTNDGDNNHHARSNNDGSSHARGLGNSGSACGSRRDATRLARSGVYLDKRLLALDRSPVCVGPRHASVDASSGPSATSSLTFASKILFRPDFKKGSFVGKRNTICLSFCRSGTVTELLVCSRNAPELLLGVQRNTISPSLRPSRL